MTHKEWADGAVYNLNRVSNAWRGLSRPTSSSGSSVNTSNIDAVAIAKALATDNAKEFLSLVGPYIMAYIMNQTRGRGNIKPDSSSIY